MSTEKNIPGTVTIGGDLTVARIGYGAMQFTGPKVWGEYPDHDDGVAVLQEVCRRAGVTFLDTADVYRPSLQRGARREALHPYPTTWSSPPRAATSAAVRSTPTWARSATRGTYATPPT